MINSKDLRHYLKSFGFTDEMSGDANLLDNWAGVCVEIFPSHVIVTANVVSTPIHCETLSDLHNAIFTAYNQCYKEFD